MFSPHAFPGVQPGPQYDDNANNDLLIMVQIESRQGVENVEKIAAVPGLDGLLIGKSWPFGPTYRPTYLGKPVYVMGANKGCWTNTFMMTTTGPFDLAKQMGVERGGEEHEAAIQRIKKAAQANGKTAAIFCEWTQHFINYLRKLTTST